MKAHMKIQMSKFEERVWAVLFTLAAADIILAAFVLISMVVYNVITP